VKVRNWLLKLGILQRNSEAETEMSFGWACQDCDEHGNCVFGLDDGALRPLNTSCGVLDTGQTLSNRTYNLEFPVGRLSKEWMTM